MLAVYSRIMEVPYTENETTCQAVPLNAAMVTRTVKAATESKAPVK